MSTAVLREDLKLWMSLGSDFFNHGTGSEMENVAEMASRSLDMLQLFSSVAQCCSFGPKKLYGLQIYANLLMVLQATQLPRPKLPVLPVLPVARALRTVIVALAATLVTSPSFICGFTVSTASLSTHGTQGRRGRRSSGLQLQRAAENLGPRDEWGIAYMQDGDSRCMQHD